MVLSELFELKPEQIVPEANLYADLDIDSIDAVDLFLKLKEITGRKIQPQAFKDVRTVSDVIDAIQTLTVATGRLSRRACSVLPEIDALERAHGSPRVCASVVPDTD